MGYKNAVNNNYDVIILDLIMAELNGLQLLNKLRAKKPDQIILNEKEKSDKIILLFNDNLNRIPGTIVKNRESFSNIIGSNNSLIRITLQPENEDIENKNFDKDTEIAIAELIENEMTTK